MSLETVIKNNDQWIKLLYSLNKKQIKIFVVYINLTSFLATYTYLEL